MADIRSKRQSGKSAEIPVWLPDSKAPPTADQITSQFVYEWTIAGIGHEFSGWSHPTGVAFVLVQDWYEDRQEWGVFQLAEKRSFRDCYQAARLYSRLGAEEKRQFRRAERARRDAEREAQKARGQAGLEGQRKREERERAAAEGAAKKAQSQGTGKNGKQASTKAQSNEKSSRFADVSDIEGTKSEVLQSVAKRSRKLRIRALEKANGICSVCRRDFSKILGGRGVRVLQAHHRNQLAAQKSPVISRVGDLTVVCANCHLLLHLDPRKALSVEKLRELLRADGYLANV